MPSSFHNGLNRKKKEEEVMRRMSLKVSAATQVSVCLVNEGLS